MVQIGSKCRKWEAQVRERIEMDHFVQTMFTWSLSIYCRHCTVLMLCTVLCCTVLYCTDALYSCSVLCCTVLY
jgi:hypothetical protein